VEVWFDGASRSNPGQAGWGAVVRRAGAAAGPDAELCRGSGYIGTASNNVAEYHGLIRGLELAEQTVEAGGEVVVRGDSMLVLKQVTGEWKTLHPDMRRLRGCAVAVLRRLRRKARVSFLHARRALNAEADALASQAATDRSPHSTPL
jgi:probable phosphoglycerate mutase